MTLNSVPPERDIVVAHSSDLHVDDDHTARLHGGDGAAGLACVLHPAGGAKLPRDPGIAGHRPLPGRLGGQSGIGRVAFVENAGGCWCPKGVGSNGVFQYRLPSLREPIIGNVSTARMAHHIKKLVP